MSQNTTDSTTIDMNMDMNTNMDIVEDDDLDHLIDDDDTVHMDEQPPEQPSQDMSATESEVKAQIKEFMRDYEEDLIHGMCTTFQYYYISLVFYAGRRGDYYIGSEEFTEEFRKLKATFFNIIKHVLKTRSKDDEYDMTTIIDDFSKLLMILSKVDDRKLKSGRQQTENQLYKVYYLLNLVREYMSGKLKRLD